MPIWYSTLGMRNQTRLPAATFQALFTQLIGGSTILALGRRCGLRRRCPPWLSVVELIQALVFHGVRRTGTLAQAVKAMTGKVLTDSALSQRRRLLPAALFEPIMGLALKPKADPRRHPEAFYQGLRLCGIDGSQFSVANTPQVKRQMCKARSRRGRAAFPKVGVAVMVELGLRNPLAAALGPGGESEMVLANRVAAAQPERSLLLKDRYYGSAEALARSRTEGHRHSLVRVKRRLKRRLLKVYADGSALVEIGSGPTKRLVREVLGRVQRGGRGQATTVRLWTSLLDWRQSPARELLAVYGRRWEQEVFYKELKVDLRSTPRLRSHTPLTAVQEIAALILAYAVLVDYRVQAAARGEVGVVRISFLKTLQRVQGRWSCLEVSGDLLGPRGVRLVVQRTLRLMAQMAVPKRRQRTCPRALRQPVSRWPRLRKNTYRQGAVQYSVGTIYV